MGGLKVDITALLACKAEVVFFLEKYLEIDGN